MECWRELPGPCLQEVGRHLVTPEDLAAARLSCANWSRVLSLLHISVNLSSSSSSSSTGGSDDDLQEQLQAVQAMLGAIQQHSGAIRGVRHVSVTVPAEGLTSGSAAATSGQPSQQCTALSPVCMLNQLAAALPQLPALHSISICSSHITTSAGSTATAAAGADMLASILQPLLLQPQLQHNLRSLSLSLASWPAGSDMAALLQQLHGLHSLSLQQCPLAVICQLPSLPQLQQLSITGLLHEPVPGAYSFKQRPMLPALPQLTCLQLRSMPLDLRVQELDAIEAAAHAAARQQQEEGQQQQDSWLGRALLLGLPLSLARAAARSETSSRGSAMWQAGQWVGSSIARQCPALQELRSDLELGPAVLQLQHLTSLYGVHPAWLEAANSAASKAAGALHQQRQGSIGSLPQLQQLQHLGIGVDTAADCRLLAQLTGLKSLMAWSSSSCKQRQQQQEQQQQRQQCQQATAAADKASSSTVCTSSCMSQCCGVGPRLSLVLGQGLCCSLSSLVVDGSWALSSCEVEAALQQCKQLKLLQVMARAC